MLSAVDDEFSEEDCDSESIKLTALEEERSNLINLVLLFFFIPLRKADEEELDGGITKERDNGKNVRTRTTLIQ